MAIDAHQHGNLIALLRRRLMHAFEEEAAAPAPRQPLRATRDLGTPFLEVRAPAEPPIAAPETDATVHALLARLERDLAARGMLRAPAREEAPDAPPIRLAGELHDTLATLRRMAAGR